MARLRIKNQSVKAFMAEIFGTCLFLLFGLGACAQYKFSKADNTNDSTSVLSINLAFGLGVTCSVLVFGKISGIVFFIRYKKTQKYNNKHLKGAHYNPAVSFAMLLTGRMKVLDFFIYLCGQFIGGFLVKYFILDLNFSKVLKISFFKGALLVYLAYLDRLVAYGDDMYSIDTACI